MKTALIIIVSCIIAYIHLKSRTVYREELDQINQNDYPLKALLPLGLWAMERIEVKFNSRYDAQVNAKMMELYGAKWARFYLAVHTANRCSYLLIGALFAAILFAYSESEMEGAVIAFALMGALWYLPDMDLNRRVKKRREQMEVDFPEFLNKLTLLVDAGLPVSAAWTRLVEERSDKKERPLYKEMEIVYFQIRAGHSEFAAYEEFAKRCRMPEATKFTAVLLMNLRRGSGHLVSSLKAIADECWANRVHRARRQGEEASTKLLFPMMMMLAGVTIIVIIPVILEFQGL